MPPSEPASPPASAALSGAASTATPASRDERRLHTRIAFHTPAQLLIGEQTTAVVVLDLSLKGALIRLPSGSTPAVGADCQLRVELDATDGKISMDARLTHVEEGRAGLVCRLIDIESVTHLRRLVELNLGDPALLERELSALITE
jgi:hypothetical protein